MRKTKQRLADLQHEAQQLRFATEADVEPNTKTRKRTESAAAADRTKHGDSSSAWVDDGLTSLTSFGMITEPFSLAPAECIGYALVNKDAEAPKPHFPPVEVCMLSSAAGGLMPTGTASTMMRVIFPP